MATASRGVCLTVGVNLYDRQSSAYQNVGFEDLTQCVNDSNAIAGLIGSVGGFTVKQLTDGQAIKAAVLAAIDQAAAVVGSDGLFILHFSCHGMQGTPGGAQTDSNGHPISCVLMHDAPITSFELYDKWMGFQPGARVLVLSDSCSSGQIIRAVHVASRNPSLSDQAKIAALSPTLFQSVRARASAVQPIPEASVILLSACTLTQTASEIDPGGGAFTSSLVKVWDDGNWDVGGLNGYDDFQSDIVAAVHEIASGQDPQLFFLGADGREEYMALFLDQRPFTL